MSDPPIWIHSRWVEDSRCSFPEHWHLHSLKPPDSLFAPPCLPLPSLPAARGGLPAPGGRWKRDRQRRRRPWHRILETVPGMLHIPARVQLQQVHRAPPRRRPAPALPHPGSSVPPTPRPGPAAAAPAPRPGPAAAAAAKEGGGRAAALPRARRQGAPPAARGPPAAPRAGRPRRRRGSAAGSRAPLPLARPWAPSCSRQSQHKARRAPAGPTGAGTKGRGAAPALPRPHRSPTPLTSQRPPRSAATRTPGPLSFLEGRRVPCRPHKACPGPLREVTSSPGRPVPPTASRRFDNTGGVSSVSSKLYEGREGSGAGSHTPAAQPEPPGPAPPPSPHRAASPPASGLRRP